MIKFFSINDVPRYLTLLVVLLVIRGFFLIQFSDPFLIELHYKGIADQLHKLGESYVDVLHHLGPIAAGMNRFFFGVLGENIIYSRLAALLLCYIQVLIVAIGLNGVEALKERNLFTGVIHIVFLHLFPDMLILSPMLVGMTFMSLTYVMILNIIKGRGDNSYFLYAGIITSIAGGFMFPLFLFAIPTLFIIVIYTRFDRKSIGLYLMGLFLPVFFLLGYYYFKDSALEYLEINTYYGFSVRFLSQLPFIDYFIIALVPTVLLVIAFFKILAMYNMVNYQQKMIVASVFYLATSAIIFLLLPNKTIFYYYLFVPFLIHLLGLLFIDTQNQKRAEISVIVVFIIVLSLPFLNKIERLNKYIDYKPLMAQKVIENYGQVLNLSEDKNVLFNNTYATGFCEYMIAKKYFLSDSEASTIIVYENFMRDMPDAIYDPNGIVADKMKQIPELKKQFHFIKSLNLYRHIK